MENNTDFKILESKQVGYTCDFKILINKIKFNDEGLIPAIAQQYDSLEVLMLAWMNREALLETLTTGRVCYWSRSRKSLWRKGETSGHNQYLKQLRIDCDGDTLLLFVNQQGPACHTKRPNCFYLQVKPSSPSQNTGNKQGEEPQYIVEICY